MTTRTMQRGDTVTVGTVAPRVGASAIARRDYGAHNATLVRHYPGGAYDTGTMWVYRDSRGVERIADESMLTKTN